MVNMLQHLCVHVDCHVVQNCLWFNDFGMLEICWVFMKYFPQLLHSDLSEQDKKWIEKKQMGLCEGTQYEDDLTCQEMLYMCIWHASASLLWLPSIQKTLTFGILLDSEWMRLRMKWFRGKREVCFFLLTSFNWQCEWVFGGNICNTGTCL